MEEIKLQLRVPKDLVEQLDRCAKRIAPSPQPTHVSFSEWARTYPRGQYFIEMLRRHPKFKSWPMFKINELQRRWYREDVPPVMGRPKILDVRLEVLRRALDLFEKTPQEVMQHEAKPKPFEVVLNPDDYLSDYYYQHAKQHAQAELIEAYLQANSIDQAA